MTDEQEQGLSELEPEAPESEVGPEPESGEPETEDRGYGDGA